MNTKNNRTTDPAEMPVSLAKVYWNYMDCRRYRRYIVRSMGRGRGFGILDIYTNTFVMWGDGIPRANAQAQLSGYTTADLARYWKGIADAIKANKQEGCAQ